MVCVWSARHETCEGQNSTCSQVLLNLLSAVVVSDCASLYLSAREMLVMAASFQGALRPWEFMFVAWHRPLRDGKEEEQYEGAC